MGREDPVEGGKVGTSPGVCWSPERRQNSQVPSALLKYPGFRTLRKFTALLEVGVDGVYFLRNLLGSQLSLGI